MHPCPLALEDTGRNASKVVGERAERNLKDVKRERYSKASDF